MIRNESEYQKAVRRQREERDRLAQHRARLAELGLNEEELSMARSHARRRAPALLGGRFTRD